jgi:hypothetical protein
MVRSPSLSPVATCVTGFCVPASGPPSFQVSSVRGGCDANLPLSSLVEAFSCPFGDYKDLVGFLGAQQSFGRGRGLSS